MAKGTLDEERGGMWWWDSSISVYWTWDSPDIILKKFSKIIARYGLGGAMAWSLGGDSYTWEHLQALRDGVKQHQ